MILVTGSTGNLGSATIDFLLEKVPASSIAALARDEKKTANLKAKGINVRIGSYDDYTSLVKAFTGINKLLLVSSNDMENRSAQQINVINAAKEAGIQHIIYTSVNIKDPNKSAIPFITESHLATENYIKGSGLVYTILKNNLYADVLPLFLGEKVLETGVFFPAGNGRVPFATRSNMAEVAAHVLTSDEHDTTEYEISSDITYSFAEVAHILSELSGKPVQYIDTPEDIYVNTLSKAGVPELYVHMFAGFAEAIKHNEFDLPSNTLEKLIGKKPTSLKDYLQSVYFTK